MSNEELTNFWGEVKKDLAIPTDDWTLDLPNGRKCTVKSIADGNALNRLTKHARLVAQAIVKGAVPEVQGLPQFEEDIARAAFLASHLIVSPPMSLRQALEISLECGPAIMQISNLIMAHTQSQAMQIEEGKIDASKNDSSVTAIGAPSSPLPETPTTDTLTT